MKKPDRKRLTPLKANARALRLTLRTISRLTARRALKESESLSSDGRARPSLQRTHSPWRTGEKLAIFALTVRPLRPVLMHALRRKKRLWLLLVALWLSNIWALLFMQRRLCSVWLFCRSLSVSPWNAYRIGVLSARRTLGRPVGITGAIMGARNRHVLILGKSGSGKTYLVKAALRSGKLGRRVIVIDPDGEYAEIPGVDEVTLDELLEKCPEESYFNYSVIMDDEETLQTDAEHIVRLAMAIGDCTVIFEEIADYSANPKIRTVFRRGRKLGVRCIAISQRPAEIHKTVTSQAACVIAFHFDEPRDVEYIKLRFGRNAAAEVQTLDPRKYDVAVWGERSIFVKDFT